MALRAEKQGCYFQVKNSVLEAGENRIDFVLPARPGKRSLAEWRFREQGFQAARSMEHGMGGDRGPWAFRFSPGAACYIYPESIYTWRSRTFEGKEAISHVTDGGGELQLSQDVVVDRNAPLVASAWVQGLDVAGDGQGFGAGNEDFAGLWVQELDEQGRVVADHPKAGIRKATPGFERAFHAFTTSPKTAKVRFTLLSKIGCRWSQGAAIYDESALEAAPAKK